MGKRILFIMILPVLVLCLAGVSNAWQGRMGSMGDPYGLVPDESDYLIHPAKIANGEKVKFYGDYRLTYTGVLDSNFVFTPGTTNQPISFDLSGHGLNQDGLVGAAVPLGPGRMGIFFTYGGRKSNLTEHTDIGLGTGGKTEEASTFDAYALRLIYGLPIGGNFKLGGELGFIYCQDENTTQVLGGVMKNFPVAQFDSLHPPFMPPYDSTSWEIPFKVGVAGKVGSLDLDVNVHGGVIASGDNKLSVVITGTQIDLSRGDVSGWHIGGDLWLRSPLGNGLTLPILVSMDYADKTRKANGTFIVPGVSMNAETEETSLHLIAGAGLDKVYGKSRLFGGIYYNYLRDKADWSFYETIGAITVPVEDCSDYPLLVEHRVALLLGLEHDFSPTVALRGGINFFLGWPTETKRVDINAMGVGTAAESSDGHHWGIGATFGGSLKLKPVTLEPFVAVGYQSLHMEGHGSGGITSTYSQENSINNWYGGGGLSILFDAK